APKVPISRWQGTDDAWGKMRPLGGRYTGKKRSAMRAANLDRDSRPPTQSRKKHSKAQPRAGLHGRPVAEANWLTAVPMPRLHSRCLGTIMILSDCCGAWSL